MRSFCCKEYTYFNIRRNSKFISTGNKTLKAKRLIHNFHFIDNSNIKKKHLWKDGLHLNRSRKQLLMDKSFRDINIFSRNLKRPRNRDINLSDAFSDEISFNSSAQKYHKAHSKIEKYADG